MVLSIGARRIPKQALKEFHKQISVERGKAPNDTYIVVDEVLPQRLIDEIDTRLRLERRKTRNLSSNTLRRAAMSCRRASRGTQRHIISSNRPRPKKKDSYQTR